MNKQKEQQAYLINLLKKAKPKLGVIAFSELEDKINEVRAQLLLNPIV